MTARNLQTSLLTPPVAMSAYYLNGIARPCVRCVQIFMGRTPFLATVFIAMTLLYIFPQIAFRLPEQVYGR